MLTLMENQNCILSFYQKKILVTYMTTKKGEKKSSNSIFTMQSKIYVSL